MQAKCNEIVLNAGSFLVKVTTAAIRSLRLPLFLKISFPITKMTFFPQASVEKHLLAASSSFLIAAAGVLGLTGLSCLGSLSLTCCPALSSSSLSPSVFHLEVVLFSWLTWFGNVQADLSPRSSFYDWEMAEDEQWLMWNRALQWVTWGAGERSLYTPQWLARTICTS